MRQVAVTDYTFEDLEIEREILAAHGAELVSIKEKRPAAELVPLVRQADAVITQFAPVNAEVIAAMQQARAIVRYGVGVDNVDLQAARARGIPVCNVPDYCVDEVADHTLAMLLAATRQVVANAVGIRGGNWRLAVPVARLQSLKQMTVGVVGFGRIGRQVVQRLKAFGGRVLVYDVGVAASAIEAAGAEAATLERLLAEADAVSLHCPSTPETRRLINGQTLAQMKPDAILVNMARGDVVDSAALLEALRSGQVGFAALDVFDPEPVPAGHPILSEANVIVSPHVASASAAAVRRLRETVATIAAKAIAGEPLPNVVNGVAPSAGNGPR